MPNYFANCHTPAEVKLMYRKLAMVMHPDKGGSAADFRELKSQYDIAANSCSHQTLLPEYFTTKQHYEYHRVRVFYYGRNGYWYKFKKANGVRVFVDAGHINLIFEVRRAVNFI